MKKALYILIFICITSSTMAQQSYNSWQYVMGFGSGDLHNYIGKASFRGAAWNYTKLVKDGLGVGLEIGWNTFYEKKEFDTYSRGGFDFSGKQYRYSNHVPLLFTVSYYMKPDEDFTPFAGVGIGTMWSERMLTMGTRDVYLDAWPFTLRPELGILFDTGGIGLSLSSKFYYGFETGDLPQQSFFTLNFGLVFIR
jgi:opacity protein-like surface antigen